MPVSQPALNTLRYHRAFISISLIWLVGCGASCEYGTPVTNVDRPDLVDTSLITQEPCAPPCWQGITPGESTQAEAEAILQGMEVVDQESFYDYGTQLRWNTILPEAGQHPHVISVDSSGVVDGIGIGQMWYEPTLDELIQIYGDPDGVATEGRSFPDRGPLCVAISVLWVRHGLQVSLSTINESDMDTMPLATRDSLIYSVFYFPTASSMEEYIDEADPYFQNRFTEWEDFDYED